MVCKGLAVRKLWIKRRSGVMFGRYSPDHFRIIPVSVPIQMLEPPP
jgi:hypothetical protein